MNNLKIYLTVFSFFLISLNKLDSQQLQLPRLALDDVNGNKIELQSICDTNELVLISFWATWCPPCLKELNAIHKLYSEWQINYNLTLLAVSIEPPGDKEKVKNKVSGYGWRYQILLDDKELFFDSMNLENPPSVLLINKNVEVVWSHKGCKSGDEIELENKIKEFSKIK